MLTNGILHKPELLQEYETHKTIWDFEIQTEVTYPDQKTDLVLNYKKKRKCYQGNFNIPLGQ